MFYSSYIPPKLSLLPPAYSLSCTLPLRLSSFSAFLPSANHPLISSPSSRSLTDKEEITLINFPRLIYSVVNLICLPFNYWFSYAMNHGWILESKDKKRVVAMKDTGWYIVRESCRQSTIPEGISRYFLNLLNKCVKTSGITVEKALIYPGTASTWTSSCDTKLTVD